jgi:hypothetical protein
MLLSSFLSSYSLFFCLVFLFCVKDKYAVNTEVYGVRALTANSLMDAVDSYYPIDNSLLM